MARRSNRTIELRVSEVLRDSGIRIPAVDVRWVSRCLGATVKSVSANSEISGMLYRRSDGAVIGINEDHHVHRQRFSIAHEIGHLCLHSKDLYLDHGGPSVHWRDAVSGQGVEDDEIEANHFAACLLMPRDFLVSDLRSGQIPADALSRGDDNAIASLAKRYRVSPQAITLRLINLRFIDPKPE
jgi:Zn-dependent peptidase ImmA (M78 family)